MRPVVSGLSAAMLAADLWGECESPQRSLTPNPFEDGRDASCHEPEFCSFPIGEG